ncbi:gamma-tubulin complex component 4-like [Centruroides sculpturatus]|nr:gamma-tubulin complex component 4-like [Centruroides sculpturatus]
MELHQCWAFQMDKKGLGRESISVPLWQLRTHMSFLVDNLQYYLQVDVLESQFSLFVEKVKSIKDFEEIQHAHENFLTSITSQSFLMLEPVYLCLKEILNQCLALCTLVLQSSPFGQKELTQLNSIALNFRRQTHLLFRVLSSFYSHHSSPHLAQLLLRIDYNKYFSSCGGQLGG